MDLSARDGAQLEFRSIENVPPGSIYRLLAESYMGWPDRDTCLDDWQSADRDFFGSPGTIGSCAIFSFHGGELAGFVSWDPRQFPTALIGHNCVLPAHQNRGIGRAQLQRALAWLASMRFCQALVSTGDSDFFLPARRMYTACGFREVGRKPAKPGATMGTVDYSLELAPDAHHP